MRTWTRTPHARLCGGCGHAMKPKDPVQLVKVLGVARVLARCSQCADGDVPPDLPADMEIIGERPQPVMVSLGGMARDYKRAQGGDQ
jgi:hypothetical protein